MAKFKRNKKGIKSRVIEPHVHKPFKPVEVEPEVQQAATPVRINDLAPIVDSNINISMNFGIDTPNETFKVTWGQLFDYLQSNMGDLYLPLAGGSLSGSVIFNATNRFRTTPEAFSIDQAANSVSELVGYFGFNTIPSAGGLSPAARIGYLTAGDAFRIQNLAGAIPTIIESNGHSFTFTQAGHFETPVLIDSNDIENNQRFTQTDHIFNVKNRGLNAAARGMRLDVDDGVIGFIGSYFGTADTQIQPTQIISAEAWNTGNRILVRGRTSDYDILNANSQNVSFEFGNAGIHFGSTQGVHYGIDEGGDNLQTIRGDDNVMLGSWNDVYIVADDNGTPRVTRFRSSGAVDFPNDVVAYTNTAAEAENKNRKALNDTGKVTAYEMIDHLLDKIEELEADIAILKGAK